jgi:hypothetical protein
VTASARQPRLARFAIGLAALLLYCTGALVHLHHVNVDARRTDQSAYLDYARNMAQSHYAYVGRRNRMPVYPFLLSLVYTRGLDADAFFIRAKYLNIALSIAVLCAVWAMLRRWLPPLEADTLTLVTAFSVFVYKAAYAQAELLFEGLYFASFLLLLACLRRPRPWLALSGGAATGLAYLTKASVPPMLALWITWNALAAAVELRVGWQARAGGAGFRSAWRQRAGAGVLVVAAFLATISPYAYTSKRLYGSWFYNVNSTYYMWLDSWEDALALGANGDHVQWSAMAPEDRPGPLKYLREHSVASIARRVDWGLVDVIVRALPYYLFLLPYLALCLWIASRWPSVTRWVLIGEGRWAVTGFVVSCGTAYLLLLGFYAPITAGARLALSQYLPLMFSLFYLSSRPEWRSRVVARLRGRDVQTWQVHWAVLALLSLLTLTAYPAIIANVYTGK